MLNNLNNLDRPIPKENKIKWNYLTSKQKINLNW